MRCRRFCAFVYGFFFVVASHFFVGSVSAQSTEEMNRLLSRARAGYVEDELKVARSLWLGLGVPRNPIEAARWTMRAANHGDPAAQTDLGYAYFNGLGVSVDQKEALKWFQRAALSNYAPAQYDLAFAYLNGLGVPEDTASGVRWLERAAE